MSPAFRFRLLPALGVAASLAACSQEPVSEAPAAEGVRRGVPGPDLRDPRDGRIYPTVVVGTKVWMASGLAYDTLDGVRSHCPPSDLSGCRDGGRFYEWSLAMGADSTYANWCDVFLDRRGICPVDWHLPDTLELDSLRVLAGRALAGVRLRSLSGWAARMDGTSGNGSDSLGMALRPLGYWATGGQGFGWYGHASADSAFLEVGYRAALWTRENRVTGSCTSAWGLWDSWEEDGLRFLLVPRVAGLQVRCVRDRDTLLP